MTTLADGTEVPHIFVTVKLYVPAAKPEIVVLAVFPDIAPGLIVQFPAGNPLNTTLPVGTVQIGCVIAPTVGVTGAADEMIVTLVSGETQRSAFLAVTG